MIIYISDGGLSVQSINNIQWLCPGIQCYDNGTGGVCKDSQQWAQ